MLKNLLCFFLLGFLLSALPCCVVVSPAPIGTAFVSPLIKITPSTAPHPARPSNQKAAFERLTSNPRFKAWCEQKLREIEEGQSVEGWVQEQMKEENILTETLDGKGKWVEGVKLKN